MLVHVMTCSCTVHELDGEDRSVIANDGEDRSARANDGAVLFRGLRFRRRTPADRTAPSLLGHTGSLWDEVDG